LAKQKSIQTTEFTDEHKATLALAGTVAMPSPFPASARMFVGIKPNPPADDPHYLKIVERVGDKHTVTRLLSLKDLRAVRLRPSDSEAYDDVREWELKTREQLQAELATATSGLPAKPATAHEVPLFDEAEQEGVVYVPETAPVLVRTEFGVLAGEAADVGRYFGPFGGRICCG
jgi:hypothetical protein